MLLLGDGAAGKTSVVRALLGKPFKSKSKTTHGIDINDWEVALPGGEDLTTHIWDFGGQEIQHATHQFFLSKRSLYLVVLDGRRDEKAEDWLKYVNTFGGGSPVFVVLNKQDEHGGYEVDNRSLKRAYPNIEGFFKVSCKDPDAGDGMDALRTAIIQKMEDMEMRRAQFAENWLAVKSDIEALDEDYIPVESFRSICEKHGITDGNAQNVLLSILDALGVVLYFEDIDLANTHVLQSEWLTTGVYAVITSDLLAEKKGELNPSTDLNRIFSEAEDLGYTYPMDKYQYIVGMMKRFELCYEQNNGCLLFPDLLPVSEPEHLPVDLEDEPSLFYQYEFMPPSVLIRLMVRMHEDITTQWRSGAVFQDDELGATLVVQANTDRSRLSVWSTGDNEREYLSTLRHHLRQIHRTTTNEKTLKVPLGEEHAISFDALIGLERQGIRDYYHAESGSEISVPDLLKTIETDEMAETRRELERKAAASDEQPRLHAEFSPTINVNPQQSVQQNVDARSQAAAQAHNENTISVSVKNENVQHLSDTLDLVSEDIEDELGEDHTALKKLKRAESALAEIEGMESEDEAKSSKAARRLERFAQSLQDSTSSVGKALRALENGAGHAKNIATAYNKLAPWCGLPSVPPQLLGGSDFASEEG